jgi:hypothetical protein
MHDKITELTQAWADGEITSWEEYEKRKNELTQYYGEKLKQYSELYQVALTTDSRVVADAWSTDFADMTTKTEEWMYSVDEYVKGVQSAFEKYDTEMKEVEESVGLDLNSLRDKTKEIKAANDELTKSLTKEDGVIKALQAEIKEV